MTKYKVIVADPPWNYANAGCRGAAENHYPTMTLKEICALPISSMVADDAILLLWTTWPQLREGFAVVDAWGFEYVTGFPWLKIVGDPTMNFWGEWDIKPQYGVGFWVHVESAIGHQATAEILTELLGVSVSLNRTNNQQKPGDQAIVFKLRGRPEEGKILSREDIDRIGYDFGLLTRIS